MLENEEIGGTTFTEMVEDIIIDSGLDMTLTMGFVEPEMNVEEQFYIEDTVTVDTLEQTIDDEMAGVIVLEPPVEMEPTVDMPVMVDMDMPMPEPTFAEMTVEAFEDMTTAFSDMFDMEMPEDLSTEAVTELMDAYGRDGHMPIMEEVYEAPDTMASLEEPTNVETLEEAP